MAYFWLMPPSRAGFTLSAFLALLALLVRYAHGILQRARESGGPTTNQWKVSHALKVVNYNCLCGARVANLSGIRSRANGFQGYLPVRDALHLSTFDEH
jgi:hypothetical protein